MGKLINRIPGSHHLSVGFTCWILFAPVFSFIYCPYLCFVSFLYLDLYILGDDALISKRSFRQTKYMSVLIHI